VHFTAVGGDHLRASPAMLSIYDSAKIFLTSEFSYLLFFATLPIKLKLGLQIGEGMD
jgi:hypothetical protein